MKIHAKLLIAALALICTFGFGVRTASAQLQQLPTKEYIDRMDAEGRLGDLKVDDVIAKLGLKPGDVVADIGTGTGLFTIPFAKAVAPNGVVYAEDIDQGLLDFVADRAKKAGLTNVRTVLGVYDDPKLPVKVDVAFFHRVLHMIEHRQLFVNSTTNYLKPDGRFVIIDKNPEQSPNSWMWLKQSDVDTWMAANSFYPIGSYNNVYPDKYFVVYQRPYGNSVLLKKRPARGGN
jgi:ubiquinone/menaquinone biosynthesis C-methylase UbiE